MTSEINWKQSSACNDSGCVEVAFVGAGDDFTALVRNSSDPDSAVLRFTRGEWDAFVAGAKDGEFDL